MIKKSIRMYKIFIIMWILTNKDLKAWLHWIYENSKVQNQ